MPELEEKIKTFLKDRGIKLSGVAGPERWKDGPPSVDPTYVMPGARSVVTWVMPYDPRAIYDFLSKKAIEPNNLDHVKIAQQINRISTALAGYLTDMGYEAKPVMSNNNYRRALDVLATHPDFSHRFAAAITGIGTFGLSGNIVTKPYGAAIMLASVVTNATLVSDPVPPARDTMDNRCRTCKLCDKSCTMGTFSDDEEEYMLLNGELHPRGKRNNIDFCAIACFGLHGISRDKKWSTWGRYWVPEWLKTPPDPQDRAGVRAMQARMGAQAGDSDLRYLAIHHTQAYLWPKEKVEDLIPDYDDLPKSEEELQKIGVQFQQNMGIQGLKNPWNITCGNCVLMCGPDFDETKKRFDMLTQNGIVVPGPGGKYVHTASFEEAMEIKRKYPLTVDMVRMAQNTGNSGTFWIRHYLGFEPKSELQNFLYQRKAKKAVAKAGLKGKEATDSSYYNPKWLLNAASGRKMKKMA